MLRERRAPVRGIAYAPLCFIAYLEHAGFQDTSEKLMPACADNRAINLSPMAGAGV